MSRVSSKSGLAPSATRGSSAIDLGKDSGVDMGRKSQPSVSSGGIGVTQEVGTVGGMTVTGGVSVEVSPVAVNISASPSENSISISGSAELPGGFLGISGGIIIDTSTGRPIGGSIGGEIGGVGINVSSDKGKLGIEFTYQIPFSPIEISLGFGSAPKEPTATPTPTPTPSPSLPPGALSPEQIDAGMLTSPCGTLCVTLHNHFDSDPENPYVTGTEGICLRPRRVRSSATGNLTNQTITSWDSEYVDEVWDDEAKYSLASWDEAFKLYSIGGNSDYYTVSPATREQCFSNSSPPSPSPIFPPFPNPPPRRQNVDECCRDSIKMLRRLSIIMQVDNVLKGKVQIPGELIAIPEEGKDLPPEILQTYPQMVNAILLAINRHGMDAPIIVEIEDTDKTTAGDQGAVYTYNSPAVAMQAALEMLHELKAAGNARLNIQIGIAFAVTRILKTVAGTGESIREIIKMLGMPFRYKPKKMLLEFNLSGIKKGYGKNSKPKEFAEMSKEELENIIPTLLEGSECDVPVPTFTASEADDIRQMLCKLTIRKEK